MPDTTHEGNDPMGALTTHRGPIENCPAPECQDRIIEQQHDEDQLTDVQKAYNVAQSEMFQLAAYGHHRYHPLQECLTPEGRRQARDYNDRLLKARGELEAGLLRLVAEHADTYFAGWGEVAAWLRFLADDPGELSMLVLRPDERADETFDGWNAESMTARIAATKQQPETETPCCSDSTCTCEMVNAEGRCDCVTWEGSPQADEAQQQPETRCGPVPDQCDAESGDQCANHERQTAHAEGEHCFCGPECNVPEA